MRPIALPILLLATTLLPSLAAAEETCYVVPTLSAADSVPRLKAVAPGQKRVHFLRGAAAGQGCPKDTAACRMKEYLVANDRVVVTAIQGAYACATFTGGAPNFASTTGLLPLHALADTPQTAEGDWTGAWRSGDEQEIDIKAAAGGAIAIEGNATYGGDDPERVARGAVNVGQIGGTVTPEGDRAAFSAGDNGEAAPYDANPGDDSVCRVRLWRAGPYLLAADNLMCGGMNVSFTGVYRRDKAGK
ncbi:hypothetical protein [Inquilinus limosus]|uniref:Lipoprotein n=1 Tax=Inquilinus limosus MP06 TaxID=1398085 RepID=A0A0A0CZ67_9PROT|nr:hypothetical protein [Inquilinus limosus]KGM31120.1 hypothetical protein P409_29060 [Inquilinus limosus MP06]